MIEPHSRLCFISVLTFLPKRMITSAVPLQGCFSEPASFTNVRCQARPVRAHTCPGIIWRLCGGLGASVAQYLRALRLYSGAHSRGAAWMLRQGVACIGAPRSTY